MVFTYILTMSKTIFTPHQEKLLVLLRQIRAEAGLRQIDLAERLGQTQSFVSKYEKGERRLDLLELRQICEVVGIPLRKFIERFEELIERPENGL